MLYIQDTSFKQSYSNHEALISTCLSSVKGYGSYAFASASGVEILFKDKEFDALLERGTYSLILGIDEITNTKCLDLLKEIESSNPNFNVKAYYHNDKSSLFHPKFSFFQHADGKGSLVIGSGNLTIGGLRKNKEVFSIVQLTEEDFTRMEAHWNEWILQSSDKIRDLANEEVIERALGNKFNLRKRKIDDSLDPGKNTEDTEKQDHVSSISEGWHYGSSSNVLVAEIPKSGDRWKQANFDIDTFTNFFGAIPGDNSQRILLRSINDDLSLSPIETRPSVSVKSQNYRFELDAASGIPYPSSGKPIGIFIQLTTRMFLYYILMPEHELYVEVADWMASYWSGRTDRMKRITVTTEKIESILRKSVFRNYRV